MIKTYSVKEVKSLILRECQIENPLMDCPERVVDFLKENLPNSERYNDCVENFIVVAVNSRRKIIAFEIIAHGTLDTILVHPREIFKFAILNNAGGIILAHNHPSGDPTPSEADIKVTRDLMRAGQLMKIDVLDHVILGDKTEANKGFASLRELGYFYS
jgi:DNA repair protein RadC